ncbi:MAG: TPM domain-containing protein [Chlorobiaceae bacterium]
MNRLTYLWIRIVFFFFVALLQFMPFSNLFAIGVPVLSGRVNDYAAMISASTKADIEAKLQQFETTDSTQIVILTVPSLQGEPIENFSIRVAESWKIGYKGSDNGILLIVSRDDHKTRIEVGYGLEGRLTDLLSGRIIRDEIVPAFKLRQFDAGFTRGISSIIMAVHGEYKAKSKVKHNGKVEDQPWFFFLIFIMFILFSWISRWRKGLVFWGGNDFNTGGGSNSDSGGGFSGGGGGFGGGGSSGDW